MDESHRQKWLNSLHLRFRSNNAIFSSCAEPIFLCFGERSAYGHRHPKGMGLVRSLASQPSGSRRNWFIRQLHRQYILL